MKLFEYKELSGFYIAENELNDLGKDGWELVLVDAGSYIFKRELVRLPGPIPKDDHDYDDYGKRIR